VDWTPLLAPDVNLLPYARKGVDFIEFQGFFASGYDHNLAKAGASVESGVIVCRYHSFEPLSSSTPGAVGLRCRWCGLVRKNRRGLCQRRHARARSDSERARQLLVFDDGLEDQGRPLANKDQDSANERFEEIKIPESDVNDVPKVGDSDSDTDRPDPTRRLVFAADGCEGAGTSNVTGEDVLKSTLPKAGVHMQESDIFTSDSDDEKVPNKTNKNSRQSIFYKSGSTGTVLPYSAGPVLVQNENALKTVGAGASTRLSAQKGNLRRMSLNPDRRLTPGRSLEWDLNTQVNIALDAFHASDPSAFGAWCESLGIVAMGARQRYEMVWTKHVSSGHFPYLAGCPICERSRQTRSQLRYMPRDFDCRPNGRHLFLIDFHGSVPASSAGHQWGLIIRWVKTSTCLPFYCKACKTRAGPPVWNIIHQMRVEFRIEREPFVIFGDLEGAWSSQAGDSYMRDNDGVFHGGVTGRDPSKGVAETSVRVYLDGAKAMHLQSGLPRRWWYYSFNGLWPNYNMSFCGIFLRVNRVGSPIPLGALGYAVLPKTVAPRWMETRGAPVCFLAYRFFSRFAVRVCYYDRLR